MIYKQSLLSLSFALIELSLFIDGTDNHFRYETGLTRNQFQQLLSEVPSIPAPQNISSKEPVAILTYLMKIRSGMTDMALACKFNVSRKTINRRLRLGRQILTDDFASRNVNYVRDRNDIISHCSVLSRNLFSPNDPNKTVQIWDATYLYIEKSHNYEYQKYTYNSHKKRNYVKIMMCVLTDGTIIAAFGLFKATENDASIAQNMLKENHPIFQNVIPGKKGHIFFV